eukprot:1210919-Rhodomonas_salina.1
MTCGFDHAALRLSPCHGGPGHWHGLVSKSESGVRGAAATARHRDDDSTQADSDGHTLIVLTRRGVLSGQIATVTRTSRLGLGHSR